MSVLAVEMIADDELGKTRENYQIPLPTEYLFAFDNINSDQNQELIVVENKNGEPSKDPNEVAEISLKNN